MGGGPAPAARLLREAGPGLHIVGVKSDSLTQPQLLGQLSARGLPLIIEGVIHGGYASAVVDARQAGAGWLEVVHLDAGNIWAELRQLPHLSTLGT